MPGMRDLFYFFGGYGAENGGWRVHTDPLPHHAAESVIQDAKTRHICCFSVIYAQNNDFAQSSTVILTNLSFYLLCNMYRVRTRCAIFR